MDTPTPTREASSHYATKKWVCLTCSREYLGEQEKCDHDGTALQSITLDALAGHHFADKYLLVSLLGRGGMSSVYKAKHEAMGKNFAIKLMHAYLVADSQYFRRFQQESRAAAALSHVNVIGVNDFGVWNGTPYLVMEYIEGESLDAILVREGRIGLSRCIAIMSQLLDGLEHAHEHGVIHRDLKPSNVMIERQADGSERARIVDFGIAKLMDESTSQLTLTGETFGSPSYMSPEQCVMAQAIDARSDIYSVSCMIYFCLTGVLPFVGATPLQTLAKQIHELPERMSGVCPEARIPALVEDVILKGLEKEPERRHQSAGDCKKSLLSAFEKSQEQEAVQILVSQMKANLRRLRQKINRNLVKLIALVLLVLGTLTAILWLSPSLRHIAHSTIKPTLYSICLTSGNMLAHWDATFAASKWLLTEAVHESSGDPGNEINSRDDLQRLLKRHGNWAEYIELDKQIKKLKSEFLSKHLGLNLSDEGDMALKLASNMDIPKDKAKVMNVATVLVSLADVWLERGNYELSIQLANKALSLLHTLGSNDEVTVHCLSILSANYERLNDNANAKAMALQALDLGERQSPPAYTYISRNQLRLAHINSMATESTNPPPGLMQNPEEHWFKEALSSAGKIADKAARARAKKEALIQYAGFLRQSGRAGEAVGLEQQLDQVERQDPSPKDGPRALRLR